MENTLIIANVGVLVANLILIYFIYRQVKYIYKPIINTKVISDKANVEDIPSVLIYGNPYLVVSNLSHNRATKLNIDFGFWLKDKRIIQMNKRLQYLNPREAMKELIPIGEIIHRYPELFEEIER